MLTTTFIPEPRGGGWIGVIDGVEVFAADGRPFATREEARQGVEGVLGQGNEFPRSEVTA